MRTAMGIETSTAPMLSRRRFLEVAGLGGVAAGLIGCTSDEEPEPGGTTPPANASGQAPELAELVDSGDLPPLEDRLPLNPPVWDTPEIGSYGGTWHTGVIGSIDSNVNAVTYRLGLTEFNVTDNQVVPQVAESFEISADGTEITFRLREGLKWSDGQPYTADDVVFWWNDVALNEELEPEGPPAIMTVPVDGVDEPGTVEKIDDYTVRFTFAIPNGLLLIGWPGGGPQSVATSGLPSHYLKQFHKTYNPDGIDQLVADAGLTDWTELFKLQGGSIDEDSAYNNADLPTLNPWILTTPYSATETQITAERNPYFWMVDREGNQLPYIDRVVMDIYQDAEAMLLRALNGELDYHSRHFNTQDNKPLLADSQETGNYRIIDGDSPSSNAAKILFNLSHSDPVKREIFNNKDFRAGLSHAINRQDIIEIVYRGQGEPAQVAPRPASVFYDEEMSTQYTEYDVDLANDLLDQAGYAERDGEGFRLGPDGNRISFQIQATPDFRPQLVDVADLVSQYWRDVGIDVQVDSMAESLYWERIGGNEHGATIWGGVAGVGIITSPQDYFVYARGSQIATLWADWYTSGGESGEEPPEPQRRQMELYDQIKQTPENEEQVALFQEIVDIAKDEFYHIGIALPEGGYAIANNDLRNVTLGTEDWNQWRGQGWRQLAAMAWFYEE